MKDLGVGVLLSLYFQRGVEGHGAEPEVGVIARRGVLVQGHSPDTVEQFFVQGLNVLVVRDVVVDHGHLAAADAGADVGHAVVVAYVSVLIVGICLAGLGGIV